jgi:hypothetical protein
MKYLFLALAFGILLVAFAPRGVEGSIRTTFTSPPPFCSPGQPQPCLPWRPTPPPPTPTASATPTREGGPRFPGYEYTAFLPLIQR